MCGIAGIADFKRTLIESKIEQMVSVQQHRGPDANGIYKSNHVHFGHSRLAIIDLQQGAQPMQKQVKNKTYTLIYNGELYNTLEIRKKLEYLGYNFYSNSDTEVLLTAFIEWNVQCVDYLNGIFAFAVYIEEDQQLYLFRDRLGVKPLFYCYMDGVLLFSSELKGILVHLTTNRTVSKRGMAQLLSIGPSRVPGETVYENVKELPQGHFLAFNEQQLIIKRYWQVSMQEHKDSFDDTVANVYALTTDAIKRQLVSDVPLCTFLSGGIDSSIISKIASEQMDLHTFSLEYEDNTTYFQANSFQISEDAPYINQMVSDMKSHHHIFTINQEDLFNSLLEAMRAKDYPSMADIDSALLLFCGEIKKEFKVALSGECADEIFGGYPWFQNENSQFPWITSIDEREGLLKNSWKEELQLKNTFHEIYEEAIAELDDGYSQRDKLFYLNQTYFMQTLLERKDRMSMANGLEVRVPFADHQLVEYVWNIPWEMKRYGGVEKGLLREAFKGRVPRDVLYRKKNPFPKTHHPLYKNMVQQELLKRWQKRSSILRELFEKEAFEQFIKTGGDSFKKPWFGQLMTGPQLLAYFIQLDEWFETYNINISS